jgi:hypothetical protein
MTDRNGPRAVVEFDPRSFGVRIAIITRRFEDGVHMIDFQNGSQDTFFSATDENGRRPHGNPDLSWLSIQEDAARDLLIRLGEFFGHHPETASLRKDYEAERARVDKLLEASVQGFMRTIETWRNRNE